MLLALLLISGLPGAAGPEAASPIAVSLPEGRNIATCTNRLHPGNRIGYRFQEHTPMIAGNVPATVVDAGIDPQTVAQLERSFTQRSGVQTHSLTFGDKDWVPQKWTFYLAPVDDGIDLLWVVETLDAGLNQFYSVQQCFRMGGKSNETWRREIAETPAFSEYDLWNVTQKDSATRTSLTYIPRKGTWAALPAVRETVGTRTPLGLDMDNLITDGHIESMPEVGPYHARMLEPIDSGLIARIDSEKTWVCGIYWERTTHVSDHHPADCLHSIVNIGDIPPHAKRALRGKIYWFKGNLQNLLDHWKRDFSSEQ